MDLEVRRTGSLHPPLAQVVISDRQRSTNIYTVPIIKLEHLQI